MGFGGFAAILVLIGLRVPVGLALGIVAIAGLWALVGLDITLSMIGILPYNFAANWELSAVPMFLLMGTLAHRSGMTANLFHAARMWMGGLPGGLAVATNFACAGFAAASGSSLATSVGLGRIAIPEMLRFRYDPGLATGVVACAGTLGIMIPPSIMMVLFGIFAEISVAKLFIAGIVPGILTAVIYAAMIIIRCKLNPELAPSLNERPSWAERWSALADVWPLPLLVIGIIGIIYGGVATPTEAGALGSVIALLISIARRQMTWAIFRESVREALFSTAVMFFVAIGAVLLIRFMAFSGVPTFMADVMRDLALNPLYLVIGTAVIYLVLGCFLDPIGIMLLTLPVLLPMFRAFDVDLIWFGILVVKFIEIGLITPPVGLNVYGIKVIMPDIPLGAIFRGAGWFLACEVVIVTLLIAFPQISLFLPELMR
jgi:tripartite ATP-independent transporter DctM subunit